MQRVVLITSSRLVQKSSTWNQVGSRWNNDRGDGQNFEPSAFVSTYCNALQSLEETTLELIPTI